jgi:hypothetical protein
MNIDSENTLALDINAFVGRSAALLGITGSGKTNTAAVLIEELLICGLPLTIVDIEGEYWGLKERFEILVAGRSEHSELRIGPENAAQIAEISLTRNISVILDLSGYSQEESYEFLIEYFTRLWEVAEKERKPYQVILEEAHEWLPQGVRTPLKSILTRIALRGRKRGLGIILMSQRSAKVEKDVLTQTSLLFLHKVVHPTDMKVYCDLIPLPTKEVEQAIGGLQPGQVACVDNHVPQVVQIRKRHTFHAGATPEFGAISQPDIKRIDERLLRELQALMTVSGSRPDSSEEKLKKRIRELEVLLAQKDTEIAKRDEQIVLLSKLQVEMPETMRITHATINTVAIQDGRALVVEAGQPKQIMANTPINKAKLVTLQTWFSRKTAPHHRRMLRVLHEHDRLMDTYEISSWSGDAESTIKNKPPLELVQRGILSRAMGSGGYRYVSTLNAFLAREFPDADQQTLIDQVLSWCK